MGRCTELHPYSTPIGEPRTSELNRSEGGRPQQVPEAPSMEMALAVPYTHVFLAAIIAFGVPDDVSEGRMDWQGYETVVTREVGKDATVVVLQVGERKTRYEFKGTKLNVTEKRTAP